MKMSNVIYDLERIAERLEQTPHIQDPSAPMEIMEAVLKLRVFQRFTNKLLNTVLDMAEFSGLDELLEGRLDNDDSLRDVSKAAIRMQREFFQDYPWSKQ